jgi:hypothetical protein
VKRKQIYLAPLRIIPRAQATRKPFSVSAGAAKHVKGASLGAPGCSVKTPRRNDVSSVRSRSDDLQLRHGSAAGACEVSWNVVDVVGPPMDFYDNPRPAAIESRGMSLAVLPTPGARTDGIEHDPNHLATVEYSYIMHEGCIDISPSCPASAHAHRTSSTLYIVINLLTTHKRP